jgi:hypothetical protein
MTFTVKKIDSTTPFSTDGTFANPLCFTFDGIVGGSKRTQLLVENSGPNNENNLEVKAINNTELNNLTIKFSLNGDSWESQLSLPPIEEGQSQTFWMKVDIPAGQSIQSLQRAKLQVA